MDCVYGSICYNKCIQEFVRFTNTIFDMHEALRAFLHGGEKKMRNIMRDTVATALLTLVAVVAVMAAIENGAPKAVELFAVVPAAVFMGGMIRAALD